MDFSFEESTYLRVLWRFSTRTIFHLSLIGGYIFFLYSQKDPSNLTIILTVIIISALIQLYLIAILRLTPIYILILIFPLSLVLNMYLISPHLISSQFLGFLACYFVFLIIIEVLESHKHPFFRTFSFHLNQLYRFVFLLFGINLFNFTIDTIAFSEGNQIFIPGTITNSSLYTIVNLFVILIVIPFASLSYLSYRLTLVEKANQQLSKITSWSFDPTALLSHIMGEKASSTLTKKIIISGDLRGFTKFSSVHPIAEVVNILKGYYKIVEEIVLFYSGFKAEFIADEFLTFFNDPEKAVDCALSIQEACTEFLEDEDLEIGIALHFGEVYEGLVGTDTSKKYTVLGDPVNTVVKLQKCAKGKQILITFEIKKLVSGLKTKLLKARKLPGIAEEILPVYELESRDGHQKVIDVPENTDSIVMRFKEKFYQNQS